jgi:hypothetical protein
VVKVRKGLSEAFFSRFKEDRNPLTERVFGHVRGACLRTWHHWALEWVQ